jgi:hypothetical protein
MSVLRSSRRQGVRRSFAITAAVTALSLGAAAFAYFTTSGSGDGQASVASVERAIRVIGPDDVQLRIGVESPIGGTFVSRNTVPVAVERVEVRIREIQRDGEAVPRSECSRRDFRIVSAQPDAPFPVSARSGGIPGGGEWDGASIELVNDPSRNQDGCRGVTLQLRYVIEAAERP